MATPDAWYEQMIVAARAAGIRVGALPADVRPPSAFIWPSGLNTAGTLALAAAVRVEVAYVPVRGLTNPAGDLRMMTDLADALATFGPLDFNLTTLTVDDATWPAYVATLTTVVR